MGSEHPLPNGNAYDNVSTSKNDWFLIFKVASFKISNPDSSGVKKIPLIYSISPKSTFFVNFSSCFLSVIFY